MHQRATRFAGHSPHIVRAASIEFAVPELPAPPLEVELPEPPTPPEPEKPLVSVPIAAPPPEAKDTQALRDVLGALGRQVDEWSTRRQQTIGDVAHLSVELGVALAERLLCVETAANRQRLDRIVRQALGRLPAARPVTLIAHPDDIALLEKQLESPEDAPLSRDALTFRPAAAARGQLRLDAGDFFVEWDPASALRELRAALLEENFSG